MPKIFEAKPTPNPNASAAIDLEAAGPTRPQPRPQTLSAPGVPAAPLPRPSARTAEEFDTTSAADRAAAAAPKELETEQSLGVTIASLGDPSNPGFWLETPLVSEQKPGRVVYQGESSAVTLLPIDGPKTAGSRLSLAAMRLIGAPLTGLPEIEVFAQ